MGKLKIKDLKEEALTEAKKKLETAGPSFKEKWSEIAGLKDIGELKLKELCEDKTVEENEELVLTSKSDIDFGSVRDAIGQEAVINKLERSMESEIDKKLKVAG